MHTYTSEKIVKTICLNYLTSFILYVIFTQITNWKSKPIGMDLATRHEHQGVAFPAHLKALSGAVGASSGCGPPHTAIRGFARSQTACRTQRNRMLHFSMANPLPSFARGLTCMHFHSHQTWDFTPALAFVQRPKQQGCTKD